MPLTTTEPSSSPVQPQPIPPSMPALANTAAGDGNASLSDSARSAATDFLQIESIVLNLDASLRVHARAHFFSWTQGLLQSLIRHELLICTLCHGKPPAFRADGTSPDKSQGHSILTVREQDILKWIYLGKSNFEIGAILKISPLTVKNHVQKILRKLNVVNRTQAIGKALELRILNP